MGELSPHLGMMAPAALFLVTSGHSVLVVLAIMPSAWKLAAALHPVASCHSVSGVPCFFARFFLFRSLFRGVDLVAFLPR